MSFLPKSKNYSIDLLVLLGKEGKNFNRKKIKFVSLPQLFLSNFSPLLIQLQEDQKGLAQS